MMIMVLTMMTMMIMVMTMMMITVKTMMTMMLIIVRPKEKICVFPVTYKKKLG